MVAYMKGKLRALVMQLQTQAKSDAIGQWQVAYGNEEQYFSGLWSASHVLYGCS